MVTVGVAIYPVPPSTIVIEVTGPLGGGLKAPLPEGPKDCGTASGSRGVKTEWPVTFCSSLLLCGCHFSEVLRYVVCGDLSFNNFVFGALFLRKSIARCPGKDSYCQDHAG